MENTEGNGGPQADGGGEREVIHTLSIKRGVHQATQVPGINRKLKKIILV